MTREEILKKARERLEPVLTPKEIDDIVSHWERQMLVFLEENIAPTKSVQDAERDSPLLAYFKRKSVINGKPPAESYIKWHGTVMEYQEKETGFSRSSRTIAKVIRTYKEVLDSIASEFDVAVPKGFYQLFLPVGYEGEGYAGFTQRCEGDVRAVKISVPGRQRDRRVVLKRAADKKSLENEHDFNIAFVKLGEPFIKEIDYDPETLTMTTPFMGDNYKFLNDLEDPEEKKRLAKKVILTNLKSFANITQKANDLDSLVAANDPSARYVKAIAARCEENRIQFHLDGNDNFTADRLMEEFYGRFDKSFGESTRASPEARETAAAYENSLMKLLNRIQKSVIHGDFHSGNILTNNGDRENPVMFDSKAYRGPHTFDAVEFIWRLGLTQDDIDEVIHDVYHGYKDGDEEHKGIAKFCEEKWIKYADFDQFQEDFDIATVDISLRNSMVRLMLAENEREKRKDGESEEEAAEAKKRIKGLEDNASLLYSLALKKMYKLSEKYPELAKFSELLQRDVKDMMGGRLDQNREISQETLVGAVEGTVLLSTTMDSVINFQWDTRGSPDIAFEEPDKENRPNVAKMARELGYNVGKESERYDLFCLQSGLDKVYDAGLDLLEDPLNHHLQRKLQSCARELEADIQKFNVEPRLAGAIMSAALLSQLDLPPNPSIEDSKAEASLPPNPAFEGGQESEGPREYKFEGPKSISLFKGIKRDLGHMVRLFTRKRLEPDIHRDWPQLLADAKADGLYIHETPSQLIITDKDKTVSIDRLLNDGGYIESFEKKGKKVHINIMYHKNGRKKPFTYKIKTHMNMDWEAAKALGAGLAIGAGSLIAGSEAVDYLDHIQRQAEIEIEDSCRAELPIHPVYDRQNKRFSMIDTESGTAMPIKSSIGSSTGDILNWYESFRMGDYAITIDVNGQKIIHSNGSESLWEGRFNWTKKKNSNWTEEDNKKYELNPIRLSEKDLAEVLEAEIELTTIGASHEDAVVDVELSTFINKEPVVLSYDKMKNKQDRVFKSKLKTDLAFAMSFQDKLHELSVKVHDEYGMISITRVPVIVGNPENLWFADDTRFVEDIAIVGNGNIQYAVNASYLGDQSEIKNDDNEITFTLNIEGLNFTSVAKTMPSAQYGTDRKLAAMAIFEMPVLEGFKPGIYKAFVNIESKGKINTVEREIGINYGKNGELRFFDPYGYNGEMARGLDLRPVLFSRPENNKRIIYANKLKQYDKGLTFREDWMGNDPELLDYQIEARRVQFDDSYKEDFENIEWIEVYVNKNRVRVSRSEENPENLEGKVNINNIEYKVSVVGMKSSYRTKYFDVVLEYEREETQREKELFGISCPYEVQGLQNMVDELERLQEEEEARGIERTSQGLRDLEILQDAKDDMYKMLEKLQKFRSQTEENSKNLRKKVEEFNEMLQKKSKENQGKEPEVEYHRRTE